MCPNQSAPSASPRRRAGRRRRRSCCGRSPDPLRERVRTAAGCPGAAGRPAPRPAAPSPARPAPGSRPGRDADRCCDWPKFLPSMWTLPWAARARNVGTMTATETTKQIPVRLDFDACAPGFSRAMTHLDKAATKELDRAGIDPRLRQLVRIRASQLNGCAYCIDMHTKDARAIGETEQRLYALPAWAETPYFSDRERAALAFTETVTLLAGTHVPAAAYQDAAAEFSEDEIAALVSLIVTINAWNAISVSTRAWVPGSYQP